MSSQITDILRTNVAAANPHAAPGLSANTLGNSQEDAFKRAIAGTDGAGTLAAQALLQQQGGSNHIDVSVAGNGFFKVAGPQGDLYTREGSFHVNPSGSLVNQQNQAVQPPMTLPAGAQITQVKSDGTVSYRDATGALVTVHLQLFQFPNASGLAQVGKTQWVATAISGEAMPLPAAAAQLKGNAPDTADAHLARDLANTIMAQQDYIGAHQAHLSSFLK